MADLTTQQAEEKKPRKLKSPNTYVILFLVTLGVAVLSWLIPGGAYDLNEAGQAISGTYHAVDANPQGIWDVFLAPIIGMVGSARTSAAIAISLTIMAFGSFLEMMDNTGAIKSFLGQVTSKSQGNMHALIIALVSIMAFFGTLEGAYAVSYTHLMLPTICSV